MERDGGRRPGSFTYWAYRGALEVATRVGSQRAAPAGRVIGGLFHRLSHDRRAVHARHIQRALGRPLGRAELEARLARSFRSYGRYWVEVLAAGSFTPAFLEGVLDVPAIHHMSEPVAAGRGCILALPHLGNWDMAGAWVAAHGWPLSSVAEVLDPPALTELFIDVRRRLGMTIYPLDRTQTAARGLLRDLQAGGVVALLADRDIFGDGIDVTFFGERTTVPAGPAMLALRSGAPLVPTGVFELPGGRYEGVLLPPVPVPAGRRGREAVASMTQEMIRQFEGLIRRAPEQWHLFQPNWPSDLRALRSA